MKAFFGMDVVANRPRPPHAVSLICRRSEYMHSSGRSKWRSLNWGGGQEQASKNKNSAINDNKYKINKICKLEM